MQGTYSKLLFVSEIMQVEKSSIRTLMQRLKPEVQDKLQFPQKEESYIQEFVQIFAASGFINQKSNKYRIVISTAFATFEFVDWFLDGNIATLVLDKGKIIFPGKIVFCNF